MKKVNARRMFAVGLIVILWCICIPINALAVKSIGLEVVVPKTSSEKLAISWSRHSEADYYAYSVRDLDTNALLENVTSTGTKCYANVSGSRLTDGHRYRVWVGACCKSLGDDPNVTDTWSYTGMETVTVKFCKHAHTDTEWYSISSYTSVSDTQHKVTGYMWDYCTDCFEHVGSKYKVTEIEPHDFDSFGDCRLCDYTHECTHSRTKYVAIDGYPAYKYYSPTEHILDIQYKEVCKDCDKVVNKVVDSQRVYEHEAHTFDANGTCTKCGYKIEQLAKPSVVSPSAWGQLTAGSSVVFDWDSVAGANKYHYYIKQLSGEPDTSNDNEPSVNSWDAEVGSSTTKYTLSGTNVKAGYWYKFVVAALSNTGKTSWSDWIYVFVQRNGNLDRPVITSPLAGQSYEAGNDIRFLWAKVDNATSYTYYIKQLAGEPDYSDNEKASNSWTGTTQASSRGYTLNGSNVQPNTWYKFVVEAKADGYNNSWSRYTYIKIPPQENWIEVTAPRGLTNVYSEAYSGNSRLRVYDASQSYLESIDSKAFYNCANLIAVKLPDTVVSIADDAFSQCPNLTIYCTSGSTAESYAKLHGINVELYGFAVEKDLLTLSAENWVIGSDNAASKVINVTSTGNWKAVSSQSWLTVSKSSGTNGESVVLNAAKNTGTSERNAKVTFTSGTATAVINVNQSAPAGPSPTVVPTVSGNWSDSSTITVTLGDRYALRGSISVTNGKLGVVSVSVQNGPNQALTHNYDGKVSSISLASESDFIIDTVNDPDFNKTGTYSLTMYAKAYGSNTAVKIGEKTLVIKSSTTGKTPVVTASLVNSKVSNSGSGRLGVTISTTYADRFYIEVLNGSTPITINDQWAGTVKKREYNGDDFAMSTLYTTTSKSWGTVYFTIPQGTAPGDYCVRITAYNDQNGAMSETTHSITIGTEPLDTDIRIDDCKLTAYTVKAGGMVCVKLKANNAYYFSAEIDQGISKVTDNFLNGVGVKNRMASILLPVPSDISAGTHIIKVVCSTPGQNDVVKMLSFNVEYDFGIELAWPVSAKTVNSHFGERYVSETPGASVNHKGIDIPAVEGTPIYVPADGVVKVSSLNGSYGYYVKIEHSNGISSFYGHMKEASKLVVGATVRKGDLIGYVGGTGTGGKIAYGKHLHFGVLRNGTDVDPLSGYVDRTGISYSIKFYQYP